MVIGIIGGGQLAKMLVLAGYPMGQEFIVLDPAPDAAAGLVARHIVGDYDDPEKLQQLAELADVITFDFENVPASAIEQLSQSLPVYPSAQALAVSQDRCNEKELFKQLEIPTVDFYCVDSYQQLLTAIEQIGVPSILKTRRLGYDGKGQQRILAIENAEAAWQGVADQASILEAFIAFEREVSIIAVRSREGIIACYPLIENEHQDGILRISQAPYQDEALQQQAEQYITRLLNHLDYVGILTLEFFVKDNTLLANEMAPRVHNTGHWSIEGAGISQFENHLRAICNLPLGSTDIHSHAAMVNFISMVPPAEKILAIPGCHFHDYGKKPRPGRKVGHATLRASNKECLQEKIKAIQALLED